MSLEGFWQQSRLLENKIKETYTGDEKVGKFIRNIKKETERLYKEAQKEGGELQQEKMSEVDKQQWRRNKYLELLYNNIGKENIDKFVEELELEQFDSIDEISDLAVSMEFLAPYNFDFNNVPLENGEFSDWDQNRWTQLQYKHTGDIKFLEMLKRPAFIENE